MIRLHPPAAIRTCKRLDLLSNDLYTSVVTSVELKNHLPHVVIAVYLSRQSQDRRRLASAWGPVEEEVW